MYRVPIARVYQGAGVHRFQRTVQELYPVTSIYGEPLKSSIMHRHLVTPDDSFLCKAVYEICSDLIPTRTHMHLGASRLKCDNEFIEVDRTWFSDPWAIADIEHTYLTDGILANIHLIFNHNFVDDIEREENRTSDAYLLRWLQAKAVTLFGYGLCLKEPYLPAVEEPVNVYVPYAVFDIEPLRQRVEQWYLQPHSFAHEPITRY